MKKAGMSGWPWTRSRVLISSAVVTVALTALSGCSGSGGAGSAPTGPADTAAADDAIAYVEAHTAPQTAWDGPTSSPRPEPAEIVVVSCGQAIDVCKNGTEYVKEAAERVGWDVTVIDGQLSVAGWTTALNQAIALQPDGIVDVAIDPENAPDQMKRAAEAGIPVVGYLTSATPGPHPNDSIFFDAGMDWAEIGRAAANYAIADSKGTARVVILTDNTFSVARTKVAGMEEAMKACSSCEVLDVVNTVTGDIGKNAAGLMTGWINKYGREPFYVLGVSDDHMTSMIPTLNARNVDNSDVKLIGMDGTPAAYERIREQQFQIATVPQSQVELAYSAVNAMIDALGGTEPFDYKPSIIIFDHDNIETEGGAENTFLPSNDFQANFVKAWGVK